MKKFLDMSEAERKKKYGYGVAKIYERILDALKQSFVDSQIAFGKLPVKQRNKIDLITSYNQLLEYIKKKEIEIPLPDESIRFTINQLKAVMDDRLKDKKLTKLATKDFEKVLDWLRYIETSSPDYEEWITNEDQFKKMKSVNA